MDKIEIDGFKFQIVVSGNNTIISGDIFFNGKNYTAKLHNNGKIFTDEDSDKVVLLALIDFLQCEI